MSETLQLGGRIVGPWKDCLIIAEVAMAHDGSLGAAHAYIDAAARAGAGAIKFQTHIAAAESSPDEPWRVRFSSQDATRYDYWQRTAFTEPQWLELAQHARDRELLFLSSPFSIDAAQLLLRAGVAGWKVASGELGNAPMLEHLSATGLPLLFSTGMSGWSEIERAVAIAVRARAPFAVLQCTTAYPCPPERVGLNVLEELRARFRCAVGLSDHSGTIYPGLAAAALGASVIEVHVTFSREMFGPDVPASVTFDELRQLREGIDWIGRMQSSPVDKDAEAAALRPMRQLFTKSIVAEVDLPVGTVLTPSHLGLRKPGTGIPADRLPDLTGRRVRRAVLAGARLSDEDLDS